MAKPEELKKFIDEDDVNTIGFISVQALDSDGIPRRTKGSNCEAPFSFRKEGGVIYLEAQIPANPLFYQGVPQEDGFYLYGQCWLGSGGWCRTNQICDMTSLETKKIHDGMDKENASTFTMDAVIPFLSNSTGRTCKATFSTVTQKFVTKVTKISVAIPEAEWKEWKQYRAKFWQNHKAWGGKDENEKKKDEKKKDEK
eukprot:TRINITY_DN86929_c0_g1_i1.p1 TRINITY_DN86929_c0_g1~~TRINITY_DN86929_c0_g1_i1.p1  ORF type:complete len:198 (-),score=61.86 TRINITY_DN86929_c0_g1_i1:111-704(-)